MATCPNTTTPTQTEVLTTPEEVDANTLPVLRLRLERPRSHRRVSWREGTVDNEHMGKKKSKCCCIYKKPLQFGESSSEDDEECENCFGHPEKRRKNRKDDASSPQPFSDADNEDRESQPTGNNSENNQA